MQLIPVERLKPHPKNPRLVMREDVIDTIKANLSGGFHESYALQVWPDGDSYTILSGHHRAEAAKRAGITEVPCWVRDDIDEEAAYMVLATANAQGELAALETGFHALECVPLQKGGRGREGGLAEYAAKLNVDPAHITRLRQAAAVAQKLLTQVNGFDPKPLLKKAAQLAAIHKAPECVWGLMVEKLLKDGYTKPVLDSIKSEAAAINQAVEELPVGLRDVYTPDLAAIEVAKGRSRKSLRDLYYLYSEVQDLCEQLGEDISEEVDDKAKLDVRVLQAIKTRMEDEIARQAALKPTVRRCTALELLGSLEDESVDLLITDPPYSTDVKDIRAFAAEWVPVAIRKLKNTGRAYIFTGAYPVELSAYADALLKCDGLTVGVPLVWTYNNTIGPAPTHDYKTNWQACFHAYKADAPPLNTLVLTEKNTVHSFSAPDGRTGTRLHAWQKPDDLARMLVRHALSEPGGLVVDPFSGTGAFLEAASNAGHTALGAEVDEMMIAIQADNRGCAIED